METSKSNQIPLTSFPGVCNMALGLNSDPKSDSDLLGSLQPLLIISDAEECNNNLSLVIKDAVAALYGINSLSQDLQDKSSKMNYSQISSFAMKLIKSNLFSKNIEICVGKIFGLLSALTPFNDNLEKSVSFEIDCLKEFLCVIVLLLIKTSDGDKAMLNLFRQLNFTEIMFKFLDAHICHLHKSNSPYIILKFGCDIVFEYIFKIEVLNDDELSSISKTNLISNLINNLLSNNNFNHYDMDKEEDWQDETKVIAFEEFKLLLLLNEQFLIKSYLCPGLENQVFNVLLSNTTSSTSVTQFVNLIVGYLNREESRIIKILILKFLYLVFTTSFTTKSFYLNDLKILVDIFIRELDNLHLGPTIDGSENRILAISYLKVMFPLLKFSQLHELSEGYKNHQIIDVLEHLIMNNSDENSSEAEEAVVISKLATRCLKIPWLKNPIKQEGKSHLYNVSDTNSPSSSSSSLGTPSYMQKARPHLYEKSENLSQESIGAQFTRIASVRTASRNDFHKDTTLHNNNSNLCLSNNNNIFSNSDAFQKLSIACEENLLDLPNEYIIRDQKSPTRISANRRPPPRPPTNSSNKNRNAILSFGANLSKPLPTPPPPPPRRRRVPSGGNRGI